MATTDEIAFCADYDLTTPWYSFFIGSRDPDEQDNYIPQPKRHVDVPVGVFSAIFLLLSGLDHLAVVIPGLRSKYLQDIRQNRNRFRWIEYACGSQVPPYAWPAAARLFAFMPDVTPP